MENNKDTAKLKEISDKFSEETLKKVVTVLRPDKNIDIIGWDFGPASAKGDSYLSTIYKVKVNASIDKKLEEINIVIKCLPRNIGRRKTYRSVEVFRNEITFYTTIVPKFQDFLQEKKQVKLLSVPRHLDSLCDGENDYLVLEDASVFGFGPVIRQGTVDVLQATLILKTMAEFHGISFAYKDQRKEEYESLVDNLTELYYAPRYWEWYKRFHHRLLEICTRAVATEYPGSIGEKRLASYRFGQLYDICIDICNRTHAPTSVITQGDAWAPNFLVRSNGEAGQAALMLDFQLARSASPVTDVSFFICSCTDKTFRKEHFDYMLKVYHDHLSATVASLGSNPEKLYPWDTFMKEVREQFVYGVTFSMEAIPFSLLDESESFDLDVIKGDDAVNIADVWTISDIQSKSGRQRLADVIIDAAEKGYF